MKEKKITKATNTINNGDVYSGAKKLPSLR